MEKIVKHRLVEFYVPYVDPISDEDRRIPKMATHGQKLTTEEGADTGNTIYGVPESELKRLEVQNPGVFFSDLEIAAMEAGITNAVAPLESTDSLRGPLGDQGITNANQLDADIDPTTSFGGGTFAHPIAFGEMAGWQVEEFMRRENPTPEQIINAVENESGAEAQNLLLNKFLDAENAITLGEPREELLVLAETINGGAAAGPGPNDEGVAGTAPAADDTGSTTTEETVPAGNSGTGGEPVPVDATDNAVSFAAENNVDLSQVTGTLEGGRVSKADVEKYLDENK